MAVTAISKVSGEKYIKIRSTNEQHDCGASSDKCLHGFHGTTGKQHRNILDVGHSCQREKGGHRNQA